MTEPTMDNKVIFQQDTPDGMEEVIRFDKEGFHYRGQFIADAGEAHRLMVEFLRQQTQSEPQGPTDEELQKLAGMFFTSTEFGFVDFARAVIARWGCQ